MRKITLTAPLLFLMLLSCGTEMPEHLCEKENRPCIFNLPKISTYKFYTALFVAGKDNSVEPNSLLYLITGRVSVFSKSNENGAFDIMALIDPLKKYKILLAIYSQCCIKKIDELILTPQPGM